MCTSRGVRVITERRPEPVPKGSLQAAARILRYSFLDRARVQADADVVALAHTADDQVEGVVLHMLRGCGLAGMRGMPVRRGHYVRPLLNVWKTEVREFLERRAIAAYEDPANTETRFARVRVRTQILPELERDRPGIGRRIHPAARAAARWPGVVEEAASGPITPDRLRAIPQPAAAEALKLLYAAAGGAQPGLSPAHPDSLLGLAGPRPGGRGLDLPGGLRFRIVGGLMQVVPSRRPAPASARLEVRSCEGEACGGPQATPLRPGA